MKISADFIFDENGQFLTNTYIEVDSTGRIVSIGETDQNKNIQYFNGIIVPGFFNCHLHLEITCADFGNIKDLTDFLYKMKQYRLTNLGKDNYPEMALLDKKLYEQGIEFCADIANSTQTIDIKKKSKITYFTFLEIFETLNDDPEIIFQKFLTFKQSFDKNDLKNNLSPHSLYSISHKMIHLLGSYNAEKKNISTIHFKESSKENDLYEFRYNLYKTLNNNFLEKLHQKFTDISILEILNSLFEHTQRVLFVHSIYLNQKESKWICNNLKESALCICPVSNLNISKKMIDKEYLALFKGKVFLGTDSMASNPEMSFVKEMYLLQEYAGFSLKEILRMSSYYPSIFFDEKQKGKIAKGLKPGLVLIENIDYGKMKLTKNSTSKRIL